MKLEERVGRCPVCGSSYNSRIAHEDRYGFEATFSFCWRCGFVYLNPRPSKDEYDEFYDNEYRPLIKKYRGPQNLEQNQLLYGEALAKFLDDNFPRFRSILDIGGSTGIISDQIRKSHNGCEVTVVDPNSRELGKARSKYCKTVHSSIEDYEIEPGRYDLILMCRSIDHLVEPKKVMRKISDSMASATVCYVDHCDWLLTARTEGFTKALHVDHPSNFTRESFHRLLEHVDLKPVIEYRPPRSSCYGYVLMRHKYKYELYEQVDLFTEIRRLQAEERKCQPSAY